MAKHIEHLKSIIATQRSIGSTNGLVQVSNPREIVEEAIALQSAFCDPQGITIECDFKDVPDFPMDRHKVVQILVNLVKNAKESIHEFRGDNRVISIQMVQSPVDRVLISVTDTGGGFSEEVSQKLFTHGYTTKKNGHGFGLHACINFAREMGGQLHAASDGPGRGATFTLELPMEPAGAKLVTVD